MAKQQQNVEVIKDSGENAIFNKETEGLSQGQIVLRRFIRHRAAMISVVVLFTLITVVYTALDWRIGDEEDPFIIPGWWRYGFEDMPELRYGADCVDGSVGCPTIDAVAFFDGDGVSLG
ncbi:MAG: ABC transporter permease, partial [Actinobacteria bacterium]|nr:ABC transporter permease [Actinomycetota bacterium]